MKTPELPTEDLGKIGHKSIAAIARDNDRTIASVRWELYKLGIRPCKAATTHAGMSAQDVADALGVAPSTVYRWTERGLLDACKGKAITSTRYSYTVRAVERFLFTVGGLMPCIYPAPAWAGRVESARIRLRLRYIRGYEVLEILGMEPHQQNRMQRKQGFPPPAWKLGAMGDWFERDLVRAWLIQTPHYQTTAAKRLFGIGGTQ